MIETLAAIHPLLPTGVGLVALLLIAIIFDLIAKRVLVGIARAIAKRSSVTWDDALVSHNVIGRLVQVVPAAIVYLGAPFVPELQDGLEKLIRNIAMG